jgi:homoserine kinase
MADLRPARVRVPCSTSNLGSGYDTVGLAFDRYLEVSFDPGPDPLQVVHEGTLTLLDEAPGDDLVAMMFSRVLPPDARPAGTLRLTSNIPVGRGLGSSAAAVLAGFDLARAVQGLERDDVAAFEAAYSHEGHGDNAAPCLFGGLRAVLPGATRPLITPLELSPKVGFAYAAPAMILSTRAARKALPKHVGHDTAVRSVARVIALTRGLATGDPELLRIGAEDELHVPYRLPLIPGAYNAIGAGYDAGAWAITVSGAGSGLIAMCDPDRSGAVSAAMREVFANGDDNPECVGFAVTPDFQGLTRL